MTSAFSWQNRISLCPASFCTLRPNLPVTPGVTWIPTFAFQSPIMKRTSFLGVCPKSLQSFISLDLWILRDFLGGASGKEPTCQCRRRHKTHVQSLGVKHSLEKEMATHPSILAWRIPRTEKPGRLQSRGVTKCQTWLKRLSTAQHIDFKCVNMLKEILNPSCSQYPFKLLKVC